MRSLEEGTLTQSSKNPHPAFPLTRSENSRADNLSVPLVPYEATGNSPSPVESSSFRNPALAPRAQPVLTRTRTHTHPCTPCPLPCSSSLRGNGQGALEPARSWLQHPPKARTTRSSATATATPRHRPGERPGPFANTTSKLLSHNRLTVFQPFQADQPGVRSRLAFTSLSLVFSFIVFGLDRISIAIRKGSV